MRRPRLGAQARGERVEGVLGGAVGGAERNVGHAAEHRRDVESVQDPGNVYSRCTRGAIMSWQVGVTILDKYRIVGVIGEGGAGEVYEAQNVWTSRRVAVKRLLPEHAEDAVYVQRFLMEGRIGGRINHLNVVQVLDMGTVPDDQSLFIVQEMLVGTPLRAFLEQHKRVSCFDALDLMVPLLGGLVAIHQLGVVHRDIKPENIFLADSVFGQKVPKLLDFGVAKVDDHSLTRQGNILGTLAYMAPEQVRSEREIDRRADVWSTAVVLHEMLAAENPFEGDSYGTVVRKILQDETPRIETRAPDVPKGLGDIIHRALRKDRLERYDSMQAFLEDLLRWAASTRRQQELSLVHRHRLSLPAQTVHRILSMGEPISLAPSSRISIELPGSLIPSGRGSMNVPSTVTPSRRGSIPVPGSLVPSSGRVSALPSSGRTAGLAATLFAQSLPAFAALAPSSLAPDESAPESPTSGIEVDVDFEDDVGPVTSRLNRGPHGSSPVDVSADAGLPDAAEEALRRRAYEEARTLAERAVQRHWEQPEIVAKMQLVQAKAASWQGAVPEVEGFALSAFDYAPYATELWCEAAAELATASSLLGRNERVTELADLLRGAFSKCGETVWYAISCCRVAIALLRAGWPELVEAVLGQVQELISDFSRGHAELRGWVELTRAELAAHAGNQASAREFFDHARAAFEEASDPLRACNARADAANATMALGDFAQAEEMLEQALRTAKSLGFCATRHTPNLGLVRARMGRLEEGRQHIEEALRSHVGAGDRLAETMARIGLAEVLLAQGNVAAAEAEAQAAADQANTSPLLQANALGMLAMVLLDRPMEALMAASHALDVLQSLGGANEGEARIRLAYALALQRLGHADDANAALRKARVRLLERAERIVDVHWRTSFLHSVPDHAKTLAMADVLLGSA